MKKVLSQEEIDALFVSAQRTSKSAGASRKRVEKYDLRRSGRLTADQLRLVTTLHESLARRLAGSLGAYLRVGFEVNLVSIEQLSYAEFLSRIPDLTYFASLRILPIDARAALQAELSLVFPIVDLVLGGSGTDPIDPRDLTEIEEQIFETVVGLVTRDLQSTWAPVFDIDIQFEQRQRAAQFQGLMLPMEKILTLSFEIRLSEARGTINLAFPAVVSNTLLRKLSVHWSYSERTPSRNSRRKLQERLLDSRFEAQLTLPPSQVSIRELLSLQTGSVLVLPKRSHEPIHLNIAGKPLFSAHPVRHGGRRGARIDSRSSLVATAGKSTK
jgi:flagellar motor switch protein FliM